jgi:hypothetical protein
VEQPVRASAAAARTAEALPAVLRRARRVVPAPETLPPRAGSLGKKGEVTELLR